MKKYLVFTAPLLLLAAGCTMHTVEVKPVKTEHEIKPIHITLDVNLKVERELDKEFESAPALAPAKKEGNSLEEIRFRWKARRAAINELKKRGIVGEYSSGYLVYRVKEREQESLVKAENSDREKVYQAIADRTDVMKEEVAAQRAIWNMKFSPEGSFVMRDGKWHKITAEEAKAGAAELEKRRAERKKQTN